MIRETYADGASGIRLSPIAAKDAPEAMKQLVVVYLESKDDSGINQFLLMPCAILDFLGVRSFHDGSGRMSRLLTLPPLYKADFGIPKYISFE